MAETGKDSKASVVVPVYNGSRTIRGMLDCLLKQSLTPHEIIVVDDGSTDDTVEVLRGYHGSVRFLTKSNGGPSSARNYGIKEATGRFVAFTDSDCLPHEEWLANLLKGFTCEQVGGVGGVIRRADEGLLSEYIDHAGILDQPEGSNGEVLYLITANACFRRDVLLDAGLFDERFRKPGGEDPDISQKVKNLGYELRVVGDAVVRHHHKQTVRIFWNTMFNYGTGARLLASKWPEYQIKDSRRKLWRGLSNVRGVVYNTRVGYARHGLKRAVVFSLLDYVRESAFMWGYAKGAEHGGATRS